MDRRKLRRLELWLERQKARVQVERERLLATNARIEREPTKTGEDLIQDLNKKFGGGGDAPPKP